MSDLGADIGELREAISTLWPVAKGSLSHVRKPCIRPGCKACASGQKHPVWLFSFRQAGRRRCMYVPVRLVPTLQRAIENGRQLEALMAEAGVALIRRRAVEAGEAGGETAHRC
jgi:hypothetical protein